MNTWLGCTHALLVNPLASRGALHARCPDQALPITPFPPRHRGRNAFPSVGEPLSATFRVHRLADLRAAKTRRDPLSP